MMNELNMAKARSANPKSVERVICERQGPGPQNQWVIDYVKLNLWRSCLEFSSNRQGDVGSESRGRKLGVRKIQLEFEKPVYFSDLPHPAHVPEIRYESVENLDTHTTQQSSRTSTPTEVKSRVKLVRL
ncbi:hypothetical protein EVAR_75478_1 [Eumeta japonica]|uniref:Uncharacterized protein n=1 Tax=Eumeta variegata TaxID=151549 RepID=A0A4C1TK45_EUMVA|nr:hypothetical protein EVAR_75478_1 [Eumeta japonica]